MKLTPQGDYYIWDCDWCDSRNHTLWTWVEKGSLLCSACHTHFAPFLATIKERHSSIL
jgi:hypothetical protein